MDERVGEIIKECQRQEESCLYTSAGLFIWQKYSQNWKNVFIIAPIILGGLASSQLIADAELSWKTYVAAGLALLAGFFPAIYEALGMDMKVREIGTSASEFTNLRDRFRQFAAIRSKSSYEEVFPAFEQLMDRLDAARSSSPPMPEWCFEKARKKIENGDYSFKADETKERTANKRSSSRKGN